MNCVSKYCLWVRIIICYEYIKILRIVIENIKCELCFLINEDIYVILLLFLKNRVMFFNNNINIRYVKKFVIMKFIGY